MAQQKFGNLLVLGVFLAVGVSLTLAGGLVAVNNATITFQLSAKNLPAFDPFGGYPDPYVNITYENPPNPELKLGETSKLADTQEPNWPETFNVVYLSDYSQSLKLDLYDEDIDADDFMGTVTVKLEEIVTTFGGVLERNVLLDNSTVNGQIIITANITNVNELRQ